MPKALERCQEVRGTLLRRKQRWHPLLLLACRPQLLVNRSLLPRHNTLCLFMALRRSRSSCPARQHAHLAQPLEVGHDRLAQLLKRHVLRQHRRVRIAPSRIAWILAYLNTAISFAHFAAFSNRSSISSNGASAPNVLNTFAL